MTDRETMGLAGRLRDTANWVEFFTRPGLLVRNVGLDYFSVVGKEGARFVRLYREPDGTWMQLRAPFAEKHRPVTRVTGRADLLSWLTDGEDAERATGGEP